MMSSTTSPPTARRTRCFRRLRCRGHTGIEALPYRRCGLSSSLLLLLCLLIASATSTLASSSASAAATTATTAAAADGAQECAAEENGDERDGTSSCVAPGDNGIDLVNGGDGGKGEGEDEQNGEDDASDADAAFDDDDFVCGDGHPRCKAWAKKGECDANPDYMLVHCAWSCDSCDVQKAHEAAEEDEDDEEDDDVEEEAEEIDTTCYDMDDDCKEWAKIGYCINDPEYMLERCRKSCWACLTAETLDGFTLGVEQTYDVEHTEDVLRVLAEANLYMRNVVFVDETYEHVRLACRNKDEECAYWAATGECDDDVGWMGAYCAPVCQTCLLVDPEERCPTEGLEEAVQPGGIHAIFERIVFGGETVAAAPSGESVDEKVDEEGKRTFPYGTVKVLSRPHPTDESDRGVEEKEVEDEAVWVLTIDDFLSESECDRIIALGHKEGYERSTEVLAELGEDGKAVDSETDSRTSTNAWCKSEFCTEDPVIEEVFERISNVTGGIPEENSELMQLVRYTEGQFYKKHHDYVPYHNERPMGPRILTVFLYLNDVPAGGGTRFSDMNITVEAKRGRALIWPSVLDSDVTERDDRTFHEALPVEEGVKYGANAWLHLRDFQNVEDHCR